MNGCSSNHISMNSAKNKKKKKEEERRYFYDLVMIASLFHIGLCILQFVQSILNTLKRVLKRIICRILLQYSSAVFMLALHFFSIFNFLSFLLFYNASYYNYFQYIRYEKYHVAFGGEEEARKENYTDMVNAFPTYILILISIVLLSTIIMHKLLSYLCKYYSDNVNLT